MCLAFLLPLSLGLHGGFQKEPPATGVPNGTSAEMLASALCCNSVNTLSLTLGPSSLVESGSGKLWGSSFPAVNPTPDSHPRFWQPTRDTFMERLLPFYLVPGSVWGFTCIGIFYLIATL